MTAYGTLSRGDRGKDVERLQALLNRVGAMLVTDGDFGSGTKRGVRYAQDIAGLPVTGSADRDLWLWLEGRPEPYPPLATEGVALIAREETGGLAYYHAVTRWPHYPGMQSGITIGVGYDLRFKSKDAFRELWGRYISVDALDALSEDIGKRGTKGRVKALRNLGIDIPFKTAWPIFIENTLPIFNADTEAIYPSLQRLPDLCRSVLVSIVFNRGNRLSGPRRVEMRAIRDTLARADAPDLSKSDRKRILVGVEDEIVSMQRLWNPDSGVYKRRQSEANAWRKGLDAW